MRTSLLVSLIVTLGILISVVGPAAADSNLFYPDGGSHSLALNLGNGLQAFVFFNDIDDIFIHPVDLFANLVQVNLSGFVGFGLFLDFEGLNQGFLQYGVYTCTGSAQSCAFGNRRGSFFQ